MIFICIEWLNSWWMVFLPVLGLPYGSPAYCVCVSVCVESNKMHLCATSVWVSPSEGCAALRKVNVVLNKWVFCKTQGTPIHVYSVYSCESHHVSHPKPQGVLLSHRFQQNPTEHFLSHCSSCPKTPHLRSNVLHLPRTWVLFTHHLFTNVVH